VNLPDQTRGLPAFSTADRGTSRERAALRYEEQIMRDEAGRKVETAVEARAGFLDRPVLVVLLVSLTLIVAAFAALWLFGT
jgi:hypothetical protein